MRSRGSTIPTTKSSSSTTTRRTKRCGGRSSSIARGSAPASASFTSIRCRASSPARSTSRWRAPRTDAQIVAVIDSDYQVEPGWLRDLVPGFAEPKVAIVQAPQDYRDGGESAFKAMCYAEYRGFFLIGMITRNERNAIIQHGTMTLVRRQALEEVGGWAEWCITEDAELGLRLFEHGHEAQYLPRSYGRGLMPETFIDYKKQRFRWAYGAVQILRAHARALFSHTDERLTRGQRYHFVAGWLPWLADGLNLLFTVAALAWSFAMILAPHRIDPPLIMFSALPLALFTFKLVKLAHLYAARVGANIRQTLAAALAGLALSHTIGVAVIKALFTRNQPFVRTPKSKQPHALAEGIAAARTESLMLIAMLIAALGLTRSAGRAERTGHVGVGRGAADPGCAVRRCCVGVASSARCRCRRAGSDW